MLMARRVLLLSPHPDDAELGAGCAAQTFLREGLPVEVLVFSSTENVFGRSHAEQLLAEMRASLATLGIEEERTTVLKFPTREFGANRQALLDDLIKFRENFSPDLVLGPSPTDLHQDHGVVASEALRAFRGASYLGFDTYWNEFESVPNHFLEVTQEMLNLKQRALAKYQSQAPRSYFSPENIEAQARVRGVQSGTRFAEAFHVVRLFSRAMG